MGEVALCPVPWAAAHQTAIRTSHLGGVASWMQSMVAAQLVWPQLAEIIVRYETRR